MSAIDKLSQMLKGIAPTAVSKRLCFVKGSALDTVWHIGDFDGLIDDGGLWLFTLHGQHIPKAVEADSLVSLSLKERSPALQLCAECVDEFRACFDDIQKSPRGRFVDLRQMVINSQSDKPIGGSLFEETFVKPYQKDGK